MSFVALSHAQRYCPYSVEIGTSISFISSSLSRALLLRWNPFNSYSRTHWLHLKDNVTVEENTCYESPFLHGLSAIVTGEYVENVMMWDANAPCSDSKQVFIHFAGDYDGALGAPISAGTYHAAVFDVLPVPQGVTGCHRVDFHPGQHYCLTTWTVAQYGTNCPLIPTLLVWPVLLYKVQGIRSDAGKIAPIRQMQHKTIQEEFFSWRQRIETRRYTYGHANLT